MSPNRGDLKYWKIIVFLIEIAENKNKSNLDLLLGLCGNSSFSLRFTKVSTDILPKFNPCSNKANNTESGGPLTKPMKLQGYPQRMRL